MIGFDCRYSVRSLTHSPRLLAFDGSRFGVESIFVLRQFCQVDDDGLARHHLDRGPAQRLPIGICHSG